MAHHTKATIIAYLLCLLTVISIEAVKPRGLHNYKPKFDKKNNPLIIKRHENTKEGFLLRDISQYAQDDEGDTLLFELDTAGNDICTIGRKDGKLRLKIQPDREQNEQYRFKVIVSDTFEGGSNREAYLVVYLFILDENDNKPIFQQTPYHAEIAENSAIGTELLTITASDKDAGRNKDIRYLLKAGGDDDETKFKLNPGSGLLTLVSKLDYEQKSSYTLEVIAQDEGSPALTERTKVVINVIDVDDNPPYFVLNQYQKEIKENLPVGTKIAIVSAKDGDKAINAEINYEIIAGDEYGLFQMNRKTGNVTVKGVLDSEFYSKFTLRIKAYETVNKDSYATVNLNIKLKDVNDNKPKFERDRYNVELTYEQLNPKTIISENIKASDDDTTWTNNFITYWMDENKYFEVLSESGTLILKENLNEQKQNFFTFFVYATERETAEHFTSKTNVTVHVQRNKWLPTNRLNEPSVNGVSGRKDGDGYELSSSANTLSNITTSKLFVTLTLLCVIFTRYLYS